jgi:hypothetical protein
MAASITSLRGACEMVADRRDHGASTGWTWVDALNFGSLIVSAMPWSRTLPGSALCPRGNLMLASIYFDSCNRGGGIRD